MESTSTPSCVSGKTSQGSTLTNTGACCQRQESEAALNLVTPMKAFLLVCLRHGSNYVIGQNKANLTEGGKSQTKNPQHVGSTKCHVQAHQISWLWWSERRPQKQRKKQSDKNITVIFELKKETNNTVTMKVSSAILILASLTTVSGFAPNSAFVARSNAVSVPSSPTSLNLLGRLFKNKEDNETTTTTTTEAEAEVQEQQQELMNVESDMMTAQEEDSEEDKKENMMAQIKSAGKAGAISLFIWELAFWAISLPVAIFGFTQVNGAWPDFANQEDIAKVGAEAFAFANVARLALPARIALAVATTPWVDENICQASWAPDFLKRNEAEAEEEETN